MKLMITASLCAVVTFATPALAQDRDTSEADTRYEFAFEYDRDELNDDRSRRAMNRRLDERADAYCADEMSDYRDACRREVVREVRTEIRDDERDRRDNESRRYARR